MQNNISIDLGTTNTVAAHWNYEMDCPEIIHLDNISRGLLKNKDIDDSYTIPSCLYLLPPFETYSFPFNYLFKNVKNKTKSLIGMQAVNKNDNAFKKCFINNFKSYLGKNSYQFIGKLGKWNYTADEAAKLFLKTLIDEINKKSKQKVNNLTICVPVDFYEFYRAKLKKIASSLNINKIKTIDEPVAAALGYGLSCENNKNILVIDFGAGTLNIALIRMEESLGQKGKCAVIAKEGVSIGGNVIDAWIVEDLCERFNYNFDDFINDNQVKWWYKFLLNEACRVKEAVFFKDKETYYLLPSSNMKSYLYKYARDKSILEAPIDFTLNDLKRILDKKGLYTSIDSIIDNVIFDGKQKGIDEDKIDDVIMVGGSTLLPMVYSAVEKRFGRNRVHAWQPFNAVAFGAAAFSANMISKSDHIAHDYALVTYNKKTLKEEYNVIIPKGTVFPTTPDFWKKHLIPTCALGEPEKFFKLLVCEIGKKHTIDQEFIWDNKGNLHVLNDDNKDEKLIIPLNEEDPTLGYLNPPHYPSDKKARIEISFMVNDEKWLCATVYDLKTNKILLNNKPVIKLK